MATSSVSSKGSFIWFKYIAADPPTLFWNGVVNQSEKWHHGVFYTLSFAYALVALIAMDMLPNLLAVILVPVFCPNLPV
ncbi:hypothetical protein Hanom_Chr12g01124261 [Helianthus anomalus]